MGAFESAATTPPSNLTATATSADRINLSWQDNSNNESGFRIERSTDGTTFTSLTTVGPGTTVAPAPVTHADKDLAPNTTYYYRVRAFDPLATRATATDPQGETAPSNSANAKTGNFVTREAVADATVRASTYGNNNYGTATTIESKWSPGGTDAESRDAYLKFDLSGLNGIVEAKLKLYVSNTNTYTVSIAPYFLASTSATSANWIESGTGGITWNNKPAKAAIALTPTVGVTASSSGWYEWDVTDFLRSEKDAGRTSVTLVMNNANTGNFGSTTPLSISSKEATSNHPQLILNSSTTADKVAVVAAQSYAATEDIRLVVPAADGVLKGAADGDALTATLATPTTNGAVSLSADGSFLYRPKSDFNGTDTFTFVASDGILDSSPKTVTIMVAAVNDAPRHKHPAAPSDQPGLMQVTNEDTPLILSSDTTNGRLANNVKIDDVDIPAGSSLTSELWVRGVGGTVTLKQTTGLTFSRGDGTGDYLMTFRGTEESINAALDGMTFTPLPGYSSAASYKAGDNYSSTRGGVRFMSNDANATDTTIGNSGAGGPLLSRTVLPIVILATNDPPTATDDSFTVAQGSTNNALTVLTNDTTAPDDGESLIVTGVSTPANGTATSSADKQSIVYTPNAAFSGADSLTYTVNDRADSSGQSDTASVAINVVLATCATDVSSSVSIARDGFTRSRMTGRWIQTVVVKNTSAATLNGPLYVVFDALAPTGQSLDVWNKTALTTCSARAGKPYINLSAQNLAPGATLSVIVEFSNPNNAAISYNPLVLSGPGKP